MKCYYCGAELKQGNIYCDACGKEAQLVPDYNVLEDEIINTVMDEQEGNNRKKQPASQQKDTSKESREEQKAAAHLVVISVLVILFVIGIMAAIISVIVSNNRAKDFNYQITKAESYYADGDVETALSYYDAARKLPEGRKDAALHVKVGRIYLEQKDYDSAEMAFNDAKNADKNCREAFEGLVIVYRAKKQYDKISQLGSQIDDIDLESSLEGYIVSSPVFNEKGGNYETNLKLTLSSPEGNTIYYTTDGKDPEKYGEVYKDEIRFKTEGTYVVSAVCKNKDGQFSATVTHEYIIDIAAPERPEVFPEGCSVHADTYVTVRIPENCAAYYTWDGTQPDVTSSKYTEPILIPKGSNVLSIVLFDGSTNKKSEVYRSTYTYFDN